MAKCKYTNKIIDFYLENYEGKSCKEMAILLNDEFDLNTNMESIQNLRNRLRKKNIQLNSIPNVGQIKKGNIPKNKGKKWDEYLSKEKQERCRITTFKKGNIPKNYKEVGYERINIDGYIEVKVQEPNVFKLKHRIVYEQTYGKIPKGYKVVFADGNKLNLNIDNLILVSNSEELIMNRNNLIFNNQELTKTGSIIARVVDKTYKLKNEQKN